MQNASVKMVAGLTSVEVSSLGRPTETDCTTTRSTPPPTAYTNPVELGCITAATTSLSKSLSHSFVYTLQTHF